MCGLGVASAGSVVVRNVYLQAREGDAKAGDFLCFGINHTPFINLLGVRQGIDCLILNARRNGYHLVLLSAISRVYRQIRVIPLCYRRCNSCDENNNDYQIYCLRSILLPAEAKFYDGQQLYQYVQEYKKLSRGFAARLITGFRLAYSWDMWHQ